MGEEALPCLSPREDGSGEQEPGDQLTADLLSAQWSEKGRDAEESHSA